MTADAIGDTPERAEAARPERRFVGMKMPPHDRTCAVSADEDVPLCRSTIFQRERHARVTAGDADDLAVEHQRVAADGVHQRAVQRLTQGNDHRAADVSRERPDQAAVGLPNLGLRRGHTLREHRLGQPKLGERRHRVRRQPKRESQIARVRGTLVDPNLPAGPAKRQPGGESPDPGADDQRDTWS